jgi:hypothetical protein
VRDDPTKLVEIKKDFKLWTPTKRYLLTALPPKLSIRTPLSENDGIANIRSGGLQIKLPSGLSIYDTSPWGRWDDEVSQAGCVCEPSSASKKEFNSL